MTSRFQMDRNQGQFTHMPDRPQMSFDQKNKTQVINGRIHGVQPECLYCDNKFREIKHIKPHLRKHYGIRPSTCRQCNFKHWDKTQMKNGHFFKMHGRRGDDSDLNTDFEEEKRLEDMLEEESKEIRENQVKMQMGQPVGPKKVPPRELGSIYHDYKYEGEYVAGKFSRNEGPVGKT